MDAARPEAALELDREEDVRCLGLAIGDERIVGISFEVRVVPDDVRGEVAPGAEVDDPRRCIVQERRGQQASEKEMPDVVGAELELEAVGGVLERRVHDAGIVDQQMEPFVCRQERLGELTHLSQRRQVEMADLESRPGDVLGDVAGDGGQHFLVAPGQEHA